MYVNLKSSAKLANVKFQENRADTLPFCTVLVSEDWRWQQQTRSCAQAPVNDSLCARLFLQKSLVQPY